MVLGTQESRHSGNSGNRQRPERDTSPGQSTGHRRTKAISFHRGQDELGGSDEDNEDNPERNGSQVENPL